MGYVGFYGSGSEEDDILFGYSSDISGANSVIRGHGGDDIIIGDFDSHYQYGGTRTSPVNLSASTNVWTLARDEMVEDSGVLPHTTVAIGSSDGRADFFSVTTYGPDKRLILDIDFGADKLRGTAADLQIEVFDATGRKVGNSVLHPDRTDIGSDWADPFLDMTLETAGTYTIKVSAVGSPRLPAGASYLLNVSLEGQAYSDYGFQGGHDTLYGDAGHDAIFGGWGSDYISGGDGKDVLHGGIGADRLYGDRGHDRIYGGDDDDTASGGYGRDFIHGGSGNDWLYGNNGRDILLGGTGHDYADGGGGIDRIHTGGGDDAVQISGYDSIDHVNGGAGTDLLNFQYRQAGDVSVDLTAGRMAADGIETSVRGIENVTGTNWSDTIRGNHGDNHLYGLGGHDTLLGGRGNDLLSGGNGRDELIGDKGSDTIYGGTDDDRLVGAVGHDRLYGEDGNDRMYCAKGSDIAYGGSGNDIILGGKGNDQAYGASGSDRLFGGSGRDRLYGENDNDVLRGGTGNDHLFGGSGSDYFVFDDGDGVDTIGDFQNGLDLIDLRETGVHYRDLSFGWTLDGDITVDYGDGDVIILEGVTSGIDAGDFLFA